jgi:hypothetical protein
MLIDALLPKVEEWVPRSGGRLRADSAVSGPGRQAT